MRLFACLLIVSSIAQFSPANSSGALNITVNNATTRDVNITSSSNITAQVKPVSKPVTSKKYDPTTLMACVVIVVIFALLFDFSNGFHDTANSVATCVGTRSMYVPYFISYLPFCKGAAVNGAGKEIIRSLMTVFLAAFLNFASVFAGELHVANQISSVVNTKNFPDGDYVPLGIICTYATLISALFWNFITWQYGIPSSSSHCLIGSLVGSGLAVSGIPAVTWSKVLNIVYGLLGSPAYAGAMALLCFFLCFLGFKAFAKSTGYEIDRDNRLFRFLEVASTAGLAWLHGANDAQKTMGIIAFCLLSAGYTNTYTYMDKNGAKVTDVQIQPWVLYACHIAIGIGTLFGGWSIVGKMALDIYPKLNRTSGFCANVGAIVSLSVATYGLPIGLPVSTTHAMNCGIVAAGVGESGFKGVQWKVMVQMVLTWIITIPCTIFLGFALASLMLLPGAWSPFFCIFFGVLSIMFMIFCAYKQRNTQKATSVRISQKYELQSTPSFVKSADKEKGEVSEDPAAVPLTTIHQTEKAPADMPAPESRA